MSNIYKEVFLAALVGVASNGLGADRCIEWAGIVADLAAKNEQIMAKIREGEVVESERCQWSREGYNFYSGCHANLWTTDDGYLGIDFCPWCGKEIEK